MSDTGEAMRTISVVFRVPAGSRLVSGDHITGFPSAVIGGETIEITPLGTAASGDALQAAVNRRSADLAVVAEALGAAASDLAAAIARLAPAV